MKEKSRLDYYCYHDHGILICSSLIIQLYAVGYGHINTLQSVLVADQFAEEQVSNNSMK